ncbi:MAG: helix-turn-helix domain-containing protein [Rubrivivax sp.]
MTPARRAARLVPANSVARALAQVGDRWSMLVIAGAFCGVQRFSDWRRGIGIATNVLSNRLAHLVAIGCLRKVPAGEGEAQAYELTAKGADLFPTALMFWRFDRLWSKRHPMQADELIHLRCGRSMVPAIVCAHCRAPAFAREVRFADGPGAGMEQLPMPRTSRRAVTPFEDGTATSLLTGCSVDAIGDRWTQLVLASFFLGERRYEQIRARWHIATNILADRLKLLVAQGMLERRLYSISPERSEYVLTARAMDIYPTVLTLTKWGDRWLAGRAGKPMRLTHARCGAELDPLVVCGHCGEELDRHEMSFRASPAPSP